MTPTQEQELVDAAVAGDHGALGELLVQYQQRVFSVCLRMLSDRDDAAEVAQDTVVRVIQHIGQFNGKSSLSTWVIRIAMNLSLSRLRQKKVRQAQSLERVGRISGDGAEDHQARALRRELADRREPNPADRVQQEEMIVRLYQALEQIEDELRAVLVLRDIDQMDYRQIAEVLSLPLGTVKSRLFRARLALRQAMLGQGASSNAASSGN